ncbi:hypothetical protein CFIMG_003385RA [Ceratocystis fimbriata CBS 114723]|uniref:Uncharacterized protein n=1 Tax=Ceratocystis fimbriata CBS 114723 TaxID=1035309 RepID=A0A2C5WZE9_9PEZI|nr:hypothetical protein CFIMG_003385RA [Ceratocystis fimbriata CBS 114723]
MASPLLAIISVGGHIIHVPFVYRFVNGVAVSDWPYPKAQPPTIVSLISAAGNHCLRVAIAEAVAVFFWKRAFQPFPLANVHHYWVAGQGIYCALQSILKVTGFAILSIIIHTSTLARDPCFQNSIRISERLHHANGTISVPASSSLDNYFAGTMMGRAQNVMISGNFSQVLTEYQQRSPITINSDCPNCTFSVKAFGFNTECTTTTLPYNVSSYITTGEKMAEGLDLLNVDVRSMTYSGTNEGYLNVTVSRRPSLDCTGDMVVQTCFLYPATMKYNLQTDAGAVVFRNSSWESDEFIANTTMASPMGGLDGNLAAFQDFAYTLFHSEANLRWVGARGWDYSHTGLVASTYIIPPTADCGPAFKDPMDGIINGFREISLRTSLRQAIATTSEVQFVNYTSFTQRAVYQVEYQWVIGGFVVSFVGFAGVMVCLWGFWVVGRQVSMSPLEIARDFAYIGETQLRHFPPSKSGPDMAHEKADRLMVQWAVDEANNYELAFVESTPLVRELKKGDFYNVAEEWPRLRASWSWR